MKKEDIKRVNDWLNWNQKETGATQLNVIYLREYNDIRSDFARAKIKLYFLICDLRITYVLTMFVSTRRQMDFIYAVRAALREYKLTPYFEPIFKKDVESLRRRIEHINRIVEEDIHLTEYEPFFNEVGMDITWVDKIPTRAEIAAKNGESQLSEVAKAARKWNEEHPDIVKAHMEKIRPEIEQYEAYKKRINDAREAEKAKKRAEKKALTAEVNEIKKNAKARRAYQKKVNQSFEAYFTGGGKP